MSTIDENSFLFWGDFFFVHQKNVHWHVGTTPLNLEHRHHLHINVWPVSKWEPGSPKVCCIDQVWDHLISKQCKYGLLCTVYAVHTCNLIRGVKAHILTSGLRNLKWYKKHTKINPNSNSHVNMCQGDDTELHIVSNSELCSTCSMVLVARKTLESGRSEENSFLWSVELKRHHLMVSYWHLTTYR